jgi:uncharacterized small protein (DUF1192 family)
LDGEWLTYRQASVRLGVSLEAARRRALRGNWRRMPDNRGRTLVMLPAEGPDDTPTHRAPDVSPDTSALVAALESHIATLRAHNEQMQAQLSQRDAQVTAAEVAAERGRLAEVEAAAIPALRDTIALLKAALDAEQAGNRKLRRARDAGGPLYRAWRWMRKAG